MQINVIHHNDKRKVKNHMIISIDTEKAFDKIQHLFMIKKKTLTKMCIEGIYLKIIQAIYDKNHIKYNTQWIKCESLPAKILNRTKMPTLTTFIQHSIGSPSHSNQTNKRNKMDPNWKKRGKIVILCRWHDTIQKTHANYCLWNG